MKVKIKVDVWCIFAMEHFNKTNYLFLLATRIHRLSCISVEIDVKGKLKVGKVAILSLIWVPETIDFLTKLRFQTALTRVS